MYFTLYFVGGLAREWVNNILLKLLDPSYGLVQLTANQLSIQPSPLATLVPQFQELMVLVGRVIGYVILTIFLKEASITHFFIGYYKRAAFRRAFFQTIFKAGVR